MTGRCEQELCGYWTGQGCACEVMDIAPPPLADLPDGPDWRMAEWEALPDVCFIGGCVSDGTDPRGPVILRDHSMHRACTEHWEPIMRVLGEQATWESSADAMRDCATAERAKQATP